MVGKTISHYRILEKLGEGGMGVVYKARDTHLDRFVAIKVLPPERVADPERKRRFVQEAKAASALNHPNIIHIYDIDQQAGVDFIAMEYVAGKTLDQLIPRKGMRLSDALKAAVQIADALTAAHEAGIVHRDLKPGNVMLTEKGQVKVLDFGLAKLVEPLRPSEDEATRTLRPQTEEGAILGTVAYMSPEQAQGTPVDARSDIFSFGALLYEMVTGRRAFQKESKASTLGAIIHKEPEPLGAEVPHDLEKVITRCLRKDPDKRFHHMVDVRVALEELREESDSGTLHGAATPGPTRRRRWRWAAGIAAAALLLAAGWAWWLRDRAFPEDLKPVALTSYSGNERDPSFSPDGSKVAFAWNGEKEDNSDIYVKQIGAVGPPMRLTTSPEEDRNPVWSPDDRWIAFMRFQQGKGALLLIPSLGGPERKLAERAQRPLSWTPDAKWLAFVDQDSPGGPTSIWTIAVGTLERRRLTGFQTKLSGTENPLGDLSPSISPDGRTLAFAQQVKREVFELYKLRLTQDLRPDGEPARVTDRQYPFLFGIAWTADGREIVYSAGSNTVQSLWRVPVSGLRTPKRLPYALPSATHPAIARTPPRLAYTWRIRNQNLWRLDTRTGERKKLIDSSAYASVIPQYSPDGRKIAFQSNRSWNWEVHTCDADGSNCVQLTSFNGPACGTPRWSPDGRWLTLESRLEGQSEVYVMAADGGAPRRLTHNDANDVLPSFSRDGRWIYFASDRSGRYEVWKMPMGGGEAVQVTRSGGYSQFESPEGCLYYSKYAQPGLFRMPAGGGAEEQVVPKITGWAAFGVTAKGVYFMPDATTIQFLDTTTNKISTLATLDKWTLRQMSVSPDDAYVVWAQQDRLTEDLMLVEGFR